MFGRKRKGTATAVYVGRHRREIHQYTDPLDPHGNGTLRKGDPMFEVFMTAMTENRMVSGHYDWRGNVWLENNDQEDR